MKRIKMLHTYTAIFAITPEPLKVMNFSSVDFPEYDLAKNSYVFWFRLTGSFSIGGLKPVVIESSVTITTTNGTVILSIFAVRSLCDSSFN
jgi:hypothetical protein